MEKSGTPQGQDQTTKETDKTQDSGALGNSPPGIGGNPSSTPEHNDANDDSNQPPWWKRQLPLWTFVGELVLIVITLRIACIYSGQLDQMIEQNRISDRNARRERRPYVGIVDFGPQAVTAQGTLSVKARNYGISPARGVFAYGVFKPSRDKTWRNLTCRSQDKTMDYELAGPAIFQGHDRAIEITVEPGPVKAYFAVCITFMDVQGPFQFFDDPKRGPPCSPYSIKHLYKVTFKNDLLAFDETDISIEGAEPKLHPKTSCYNE